MLSPPHVSYNSYKLRHPQIRASMKAYIVIDQELCKGCEVCIFFCPKGVICISDKLNSNGYSPASYNDNGECTGCANCAVVCPEVAIEVYRG